MLWYNTMPMSRVHNTRLSKKKIVKLIDKQIVKRAEKKVKLDPANISVDGSSDITLGTAHEALDFVASLSGIAEGTGEEQRIGDEINLLAYKMRYTVFTSDTTCRMLVVHFPNGDGSDFLAALNSINSRPTTFLPRKEDFANGYKVLLDKALRFDSSEEVPRIYSTSLKVKNMVVKYTGAGALISGAIRCYILTDASGSGGVMGDIFGSAKLYWTD